jgi:nickel transport system substrate-binding protein
LLALHKGEVNFIFTDDRGTDSIDVEAMNTKMIVANSSRKDNPVHETAVREAIWYAIDRETISKQLFNGTEKTAHTLFSDNVNYANVDLEKRDFDVTHRRSYWNKLVGRWREEKRLE